MIYLDDAYANGLNDTYVKTYRAEILYDLLKEREEISSISHKGNVSWKDHKAFYDTQPYPIWELAVEETFLGAVSLTDRNEIGIQVFKAYQGKGNGKRILQLFMEKHDPLPAISGQRPGHFVANINPLNERSIHLFEGLGFRHIQNTYVLDA